MSDPKRLENDAFFIKTLALRIPEDLRGQCEVMAVFDSRYAFIVHEAYFLIRVGEDELFERVTFEGLSKLSDDWIEKTLRDAIRDHSGVKDKGRYNKIFLEDQIIYRYHLQLKGYTQLEYSLISKIVEEIMAEKNMVPYDCFKFICDELDIDKRYNEQLQRLKNWVKTL